MVKVRLDKWLWAARFFKTRALAKTAIETGKIHIDGQKAKPSRMIEATNMLTIRQGDVGKTVRIITACEHRRGAPEAPGFENRVRPDGPQAAMPSGPTSPAWTPRWRIRHSAP